MHHKRLMLSSAESVPSQRVKMSDSRNRRPASGWNFLALRVSAGVVRLSLVAWGQSQFNTFARISTVVRLRSIGLGLK